MPVANLAIREADSRLGADPAARARPSDFAQAMFDLGRGLYSVGFGVCGLSLDRRVSWTADGDPGVVTAQGTEEERPIRFGVHFWLTDGQGSGAAAD
jgi:A/G-specific adenine glycosylase